MPVYRKLLPAESRLYLSHLLRLAPEDRNSRFCGGLADAAVARYVDGIDWARTRAIGCFEGRDMVGAAELRFDAGWPGLGEVGISIERAFQGRGIGAELTRRILTLARNRAVRDVAFHCLASNRRMQAIVRGLSGTVALDAGEAEGHLRLPWPSQVSLFQEAMDDGAGLVGAALGRMSAA
jgi:GNAT superfamily N-acetyltransferase